MSDLKVRVEEFNEAFSADTKMQADFLKDPEAFLKSSVVPREYADEILRYMQDIRSMSEAVKASGPEAVLSGPRPSGAILTGPQKGVPKISFEATTKLSVVTGYWLVLNNQATDDVADGILIGAALVGVICAADPELLSKAAAGVIGGVLTMESRAMKLVNRGKGVYFYMNPLVFNMLPTMARGLAAAQLIPLPN